MRKNAILEKNLLCLRSVGVTSYRLKLCAALSLLTWDADQLGALSVGFQFPVAAAEHCVRVRCFNPGRRVVVRSRREFIFMAHRAPLDRREIFSVQAAHAPRMIAFSAPAFHIFIFLTSNVSVLKISISDPGFLYSENHHDQRSSDLSGASPCRQFRRTVMLCAVGRRKRCAVFQHHPWVETSQKIHHGRIREAMRGLRIDCQRNQSRWLDEGQRSNALRAILTWE